MKNIDIELDRINVRSEQILDRLKEIQGERTTIKFKLKNNLIDFVLGELQIQTLDYEALLLVEETAELESDIVFVELIDELDIDIQR
jgi:hypothetical protein